MKTPQFDAHMLRALFSLLVCLLTCHRLNFSVYRILVFQACETLHTIDREKAWYGQTLLKIKLGLGCIQIIYGPLHLVPSKDKKALAYLVKVGYFYLELPFAGCWGFMPIILTI
jgi:hypothetical protein